MVKAAEGFPIAVRVHTADIQDWDGALEVIMNMLEGTATVVKLFANGGYQRANLRGVLEDRDRGKAERYQGVNRPLPATGY